MTNRSAASSNHSVNSGVKSSGAAAAINQELNVGGAAPFQKALNTGGDGALSGVNSAQMPRLESSNFFKMSGMPRFGKQWLDNFIQDQELQNTFLTSEVVRNLVMLECVFFASVFNDLILYKQAFLMQKSRQTGTGLPEEDSMRDEESKIEGGMPGTANQQMSSQSAIKNSSSQVQNSVDIMNELPPFKIGIIGCGHLGTMILTKLLEISGSFNNLKILVSTRQPHLLRPFVQEFGIIADFNNERIVRECDIIFLCTLPSQASEMLKEIRPVALDRLYQA